MVTNQLSGNSNGIIPQVPQRNGMAAQERRDEVLSFMAEHRLALKPTTIYRNMRIHRNITFTAATVQNILTELSEDGLLRRVDVKALGERRLEPPEGNRGAYIITDEGHEEAQSLSPDY
jgi:Fe2+ or Zn2+ uptake regulation protein